MNEHYAALEFYAIVEKMSIFPVDTILVSLSFVGFEGEAILHQMDLMGIAISTGSACNSVSTEISHVLSAIGLNNRLAKGTIRISLGKNNTEEDIISIVTALKKIVGPKLS